MSRKKNNYILSMLLIIFLLPGVLAVLFYKYPIHFSKTLNHGNLLSPPLFLAELKSSTWQWIVWCPKKNNAQCTETLDKLSRIRLALGRRWYDINIRQYSQMSPKLEKSILDTAEPAIWVMDKKGFIIMTYPISTPSKDIYTDIKTLLASE